MAATQPPVPVNELWLSLNDATGIAIGTAIKCQNLGRPQDIIQFFLSDTPPLVTDLGFSIKQFEEATITAGEPEIWVSLSVDTVIERRAGRTAPLLVQEL